MHVASCVQISMLPTFCPQAYFYGLTKLEFNQVANEANLALLREIKHSA